MIKKKSIAGKNSYLYREVKIFVLHMFYKFPNFFLHKAVLKSHKINYKHTRNPEN